jgi:predicted transcriptional regulator
MKRGKRMDIGDKLKVIMEKEGVTGYRISKEVGIEQTYISRLIHGKVNPTYSSLKRILDVLGYQVCFKKISKEERRMKKWRS